MNINFAQGVKQANMVKTFDETTVAFAKVCDFNNLTANLNAMEVVALLNRIYSHNG